MRIWYAIFLLLPLLLALAPPISLDGLVYHLAIPHQYELAGRAFEMPWNSHTYFPLQVELLFGLALQLGSARLAQLLHLTAAVLTLLAVARLGERLFSSTAGDWAALLLLSLPVLNLIAGWAWNDWFILLYLVLALELCIDRGDGRRRAVDAHYLVTAVLVGGTLGTKYYALPLLLLLVIPIPRPDWRGLLGAATVVTAIAIPWYGKNMLQTGNPVYPLFSSDSNQSSLASYRGDEPFWDRIAGYIGRPDVVDESLGILLIAVVPLLILLPRKDDPRLRVIWLLMLAYLATAFVLGPTVRAFSPLLLLLALLVGGAISGLDPGRWLRRLSLAAANLALMFNLVTILWVVDQYEPVPSILGFVSETDYLRTGQRYYTAYEQIAQRAAPGEKVLVVGESRTFFLERPAIAATYMDRHPIRHFMRTGCDPSCVARRLWEDGVRWIYFDPTQYAPAIRPKERLTDELQFLAEPEEALIFHAILEKHAAEVWAPGSQRVLRLDEPGVSGGG